MDWLKQLVPLLGTALGGPLGGAAASFIAGKLGLEGKTIEAVTEVLNSGKMTPEQISGLKLAEIDFQKFCQENQIKREQLEAADRDSARNMQIQTKSTMPAILTVLVTVGYFAVLGIMLHDPESMKESGPLLLLLGALSSTWGMACAFWFGTTSGSQRKDQLLAQSAPVK
jgi:hypothetical protein